MLQGAICAGGAISAIIAIAFAHVDHDHDQEPIAGPHKSLWYNTLPGDGGTQVGDFPDRSAWCALTD